MESGNNIINNNRSHKRWNDDPKRNSLSERSEHKTSTRKEPTRRPWNCSVRVDQDILYSSKPTKRPSIPLYTTRTKQDQPQLIPGKKKTEPVITFTPKVRTKSKPVGQIRCTKGFILCPPPLLVPQKQTENKAVSRIPIPKRADKAIQVQILRGTNEELNAGELGAFISKVCMWYLKTRINISELYEESRLHKIDSALICQTTLKYLDQLQTLLGKGLPNELCAMESPTMEEYVHARGLGDRSDGLNPEYRFESTTIFHEFNPEHRAEAGEAISERDSLMTAITRHQYTEGNDKTLSKTLWLADMRQSTNRYHHKVTEVSHSKTTLNATTTIDVQTESDDKTLSRTDDLQIPNLNLGTNCNNRCNSLDELCSSATLSNATPVNNETVTEATEINYSEARSKGEPIRWIKYDRGVNIGWGAKFDGHLVQRIYRGTLFNKAYCVSHFTIMNTEVPFWSDDLDVWLRALPVESDMKMDKMNIITVSQVPSESVGPTAFYETPNGTLHSSDEDLVCVQAILLKRPGENETTDEDDEGESSTLFTFPDPPEETSYPIHNLDRSWDHTPQFNRSKSFTTLDYHDKCTRVAPYLLWGCLKRTNSFEDPQMMAI